ncbi:hypothetical protein [Sphingobium fuliginis]|jgi:hypothetical protein|uniref:non-homologous end-joining DNA ligase LigD n=1 Tax=Sphingobium fuliginis (strain ATCC 27551) TaxID=336203 RepID=UPI00277D1247|nr:hypothetical protein [Sphingobium fuliginis]
MTPGAINPFRPTRWEHHTDGRPLIWFTEEAEELSADKSTYIHGTRGTGKTTLLKGICWEDLCHNESLKLQRNLGDFKNIGIYVRFPDHISASMSFTDWTAIFPNVQNPEFEFYSFFSVAVEAICIERLSEACHNLREMRQISIAAAQELQLVADFATEFPAVSNFSPRPPATFLDLARCLRLMTSAMNRACGRGTVGELVDDLPVREPYQMLAYFTERVSASIRLNTSVGQQTVGFKFCLDDCEVLSPLQRKSINSLVRLSRAPCSWVVSSVGGGRDDSETFIESQPLTDADRRVISLDGRDENEFRQLCQSVVSLRLIFSLPPEARPYLSQTEVSSFFDLQQRLGRWDVNDMMAQAVAQSDPEHFTAALPKAQRKGRIFVDYLRNQRGATAVMPYGVRARESAPVAVPITWKEMETIDKPSHWTIRDGTELVKRAGSKALSGWGRADQTLPDL